MPSLDRELRAIVARGSRATATPDTLVRTVTAAAARRRARALVGTSLAGLAAIGLAATAATSLESRVPPAVAPDTILGIVTLPFDAQASTGVAPIPLGVACGDPAPTPVTRADGIEWDVAAPPGELYPGAGITTTLRSTDGGTAPSSVSLMGFVIVRDGVVAGWKYNSEFADLAEFHYLDSFSDDHVRGTIDAPDAVCPGQGSLYSLAPGDYEWYPVIHVTASPEIAAREWLRLQGYSVPLDNATELSQFSPGSWDCETFPYPSGPGADLLTDYPLPSALCAPTAVEGVTIDRDARTISLPYTARLYSRTLAVTLVGEPIAYTQPPEPAFEPPGPSTGFDESPVLPVADTAELTCGAHVDAGANFVTGRTSVAVEAAALVPGATFADGSTGDLTLLPPVLPPTGQVAYPDPLRVWFLAEAPVPSNGLMKVRGPGYSVIGTGTALVADGEPVPLHRSMGPSTVTVVFSDLQWCEAADPGDTTVLAFEGWESFDRGSGAWTTSSIFDFWGTQRDDWTGLYTAVTR